MPDFFKIAQCYRKIQSFSMWTKQELPYKGSVQPLPISVRFKQLKDWEYFLMCFRESSST